MSSLFSGLTPLEIAMLLPTVWTELGSSDVAGITGADAAVITNADIGEVVSTAFGGFSGAILAELAPVTLTQLDATDARQLAPAALGALDSAQLNSLPAPDFAALAAPQVDAIAPARFAALSTEDLRAIAPGEFDAAQIVKLSPAQLTALSVPQIATFTTGDLAQLSPVQVAGLPPQAFGAMSPQQVVALSTPALQALSAADLGALGDGEVAGLGTRLGALPAFDFSGLTPQQVASMSPAQWSLLGPGRIAQMPVAVFAQLTPAQISATSATTLAGFSGPDVAALGDDTIGAFGAEIADLPSIDFASFTAGQAAELTAQQLALLSSADVSELAASVLPELAASEIAEITPAALGGMATSEVDAFSTTQIGALTRAQIQSLSAKDIGGLSDDDFAALDIADVSARQVSGLTLAQVMSLSAAAFAQDIAPFVGALTPSAFAGISDDEMSALTPAQDGQITLAQFSAMSFGQQQIVLARSPLVHAADAAAPLGQLSYAAALAWLQQAASQPMNVLRLDELDDVTGSLNQFGGLSASPMVAQLLRDVINGNSANANWNGGSSTATPLGNLTASSSSAQFNTLIDKWFLGEDLPSTDIASVNSNALASNYQPCDMPLFAPGGPSYLDINQGQVGDCFFLAALAETAFNDPSLIERMIQPLGGGVYSVDFQVGGDDDFVTVNDELPVYSAGYSAPDGSDLAFDSSTSLWSPLIEKAYAQLVEQTGVEAGGDAGVNADSYAAISGGWANGVLAITGQAAPWFDAATAVNEGQGASLMQSIAGALASHDDVLLATQGATVDPNLLTDHMYAVIGANAAAQTVTLFNPWGSGASSQGLQDVFTVSLSEIVRDQAGFYIAGGASAVR